MNSLKFKKDILINDCDIAIYQFNDIPYFLAIDIGFLLNCNTNKILNRADSYHKIMAKADSSNKQAKFFTLEGIKWILSQSKNPNIEQIRKEFAPIIAELEGTTDLILMEEEIVSDGLIPVTYKGDRATISARRLHKFLESKAQFTDWFKRMCEYGFEENVDFASLSQKCEKPQGGRPAQDYQLTIDMAKEVSMLQRNEKGKQARQYFIQLDKDWNDPNMIVKRALQIANKEIKQLGTKIELDKPKVKFADAVSSSKTTILVGEFAKFLRQNGLNFSQNKLYEWFRKNGYVMKTGSSYNLPTQRSMDRGWMEIKENYYFQNGVTKLSRTTKITGKGQQYFVNKLLKGE